MTSPMITVSGTAEGGSFVSIDTVCLYVLIQPLIHATGIVRGPERAAALRLRLQVRQHELTLDK